MKANTQKFLKIYIKKLKYFNYTENTINIYAHYAQRFVDEVGKYPQHMTSEDFQNYLNQFNFTSVSQQNQVINAIKFLYEKVLQKKYKKIDFSRPRNEKKLPYVIDGDFILQKINSIKNIKHKAIIALAYSVGLRVSEVINLKIEDIDSKRMVIHIRQAKGKKDRIVQLSQNILNILREYWKAYHPKVFLFNGQKSLRYSATSCNNIVKDHLGQKNHFHLLRHSCFTMLIETGTDLRIIQKIAGHASSKTTEIYTHVSNNLLQKVALPI
jgi:integrase/recombinase XerD